ncbi:SUF system NifU family Fe-S cluster assembly protein [Granulicatella sp. zg-ZJ]|uniref:Fe-S cluster assembly sulfur transfer protein SufU n=1 Tax=Granulicatella sp. zg-ZJ TaxID=2678504 RepID=UPI0013D6BC76|nr:SUF system NifU family Fe-S cluster assembly protein [Granulicatella sp. zg-ZJ]NEW62138.1 SUF system NifU family Fe-S cluster assembly protein [Granulicatella sp. zg-ZJ]
MVALKKLDDLYRQVILDHSAHPRQFRKQIEETDSLEMLNPTCGDVITVHIRAKENRIEDISFSGEGCTISKASASMMCELLKGEDVALAKEKIKSFFELVQGHDVGIDLADAELLQGVSKFPTRIKCATLSWKVLETLLERLEENE